MSLGTIALAITVPSEVAVMKTPKAKPRRSGTNHLHRAAGHDHQVLRYRLSGTRSC
jgi:hypothetical protein